MHANLPAKGFHDGLFGSAFKRHQHANLAKPRFHGGMHIGRNRAFRDLEALGAADGHILANRRDQMRQLIRNRLAHSGFFNQIHRPRPGGILQRFKIIADRQHQFGYRFHEMLEGFIARDEIRLGIHLHHGGDTGGRGYAHQPFRSHAAGFLGGR